MKIETIHDRHMAFKLCKSGLDQNPLFLSLETKTADRVREILDGKGVTHVDYYANPYSNRDKGISHPWLDERGPANSYVLSPVDSNDKKSEWYYTCTGIAMVGKWKTDDGNVSFLTHQNPDFIFDSEEKWHLFESELGTKIRELQETVLEGSVAVTIFGWNHSDEPSYKKSIERIVALFQEKHALQPEVVPREPNQKITNAFLDTAKGRLHLAVRDS